MQYYISIHAPLAGCDPGLLLLLFFGIKISIHAPLAGCDRRTLVIPSSFDGFQSTHPLRGATLLCLRRAKNKRISIHAPLAGCDKPPNQAQVKIFYFNPRTPCGVRPSRSCSRPSTTATFQSTHPLRGATAGTGFEPIAQGHFNPRTPCGVRLNISMIIASAVMYFNPRTPCGVRQKIQNHKDSAKYFNPRTPCGVRQGGALFYRAALYFNPRTPCGVRRCIHFDKFQPQTISIHAPLAGCDPRRKLLCNNKTVFQSTHPLRGATILAN